MHSWVLQVLNLLILPLLMTTVTVASQWATAAEPTAAPVTHDELMSQAEAKRDAGAYADAADLCAKAYRALPDEDRQGDLGGFIIKNAMQDYRSSLEEPPQGIDQTRAHLTLLRAEADLLREFMTERDAGAVPPVVETTLAELGSRIRVLERREAELASREVVHRGEIAPVPLTEPSPTASSSRESAAPSTPARLGKEVQSVETDRRTNQSTVRVQAKPLHSRKSTEAILSAGGVSVVAGAAMIGGGTWMFTDFMRHANDMDQQYDREVALGALSESEKQRRLDEVERFRADSLAKARGVVIGGAVMAAAGFGVSAWGMARIQQNRKAIRREALVRGSSRPVGRDGTGLIIASTVTGSLAWANSTISRLMAMRFCIEDIDNARDEVRWENEDLDEVGEPRPYDYNYSSLTGCAVAHDSATAWLMVTNWVLNGATYGLAPAAGDARGHHHRLMARWSGVPHPKATAFAGTGAALISAGVAGRIVGIVFTVRDCASLDATVCHRNVALGILGAQFSSSVIALGAGLLQYGLALQASGKYRRRPRPRDNRRQIKGVPELGWRYAGVTFMGRF